MNDDKWRWNPCVFSQPIECDPKFRSRSATQLNPPIVRGLKSLRFFCQSFCRKFSVYSLLLPHCWVDLLCCCVGIGLARNFSNIETWRKRVFQSSIDRFWCDKVAKKSPRWCGPGKRDDESCGGLASGAIGATTPKRIIMGHPLATETTGALLHTLCLFVRPPTRVA